MTSDAPSSATGKQPRRRWLQFSLRTLLLFTVLLAVGVWLVMLALREDDWHMFGMTLVLENEAPNEQFYNDVIVTPEFRETFYTVLQESGVEFVGDRDQLSFKVNADKQDVLFYFRYPVRNQDSYLDYGKLLEETLRRYSQQTGDALPFEDLTFEKERGGDHAQ